MKSETDFIVFSFAHKQQNKLIHVKHFFDNQRNNGFSNSIVKGGYMQEGWCIFLL